MTARAGGSVFLRSKVKKLVNVIKLRLIERIDDLEIWLVNGKLIRDHIFIDFTEGGNSEAYVWMPDKEIWLDTDVHPSEIDFVKLHELREYNEMHHEGLDYDPAHDKANGAEAEARRDRSKLNELYNYEVKRYKEYESKGR